MWTGLRSPRRQSLKPAREPGAVQAASAAARLSVGKESTALAVRNWGAALGERAPVLMSAGGLVAEAIAFSVVVLIAVYTLINRPSEASRT